MKKIFFLLFVLCTTVFFAHTPLLLIEDNGDGTLYAEAGFSDGSGAQGIECRFEDEDGNILWQGKFDDFSSVEVDIPDVPKYFVVFDAGPGHVVKKEGPTKAVAEEKPVVEAEAPAQPAVVQTTVQTAPAPVAYANPASYYPVRDYGSAKIEVKEFAAQLTLVSVFLGIIAICMIFIVFILMIMAVRQKK